MSNILHDNKVSFYKTLEATYPSVKPYHPSERYPEISYKALSGEQNYAFDAIRNALALCELDKENLNTPQWNPFGRIIKPHDQVLIKPNLVSHYNWGYKSGLEDTDSLITHGSVIRGVIDYVIIALEGKGKIVLGDSPVQLSSWEKLMEMIGYKEIKLFFETAFPEITIVNCDFRLGYALRNISGVIVRSEINFDENKFIETDLGQFSLHSPVTKLNTEYGVVDYSKKRLRKTHNLVNHKYLFPKSVIEADVFINVPKLKTHSKAGISCSLKNFVGINSFKDYLPHFRFGSTKYGGDEYHDNGALYFCIWNIFLFQVKQERFLV